MQVKSGIWAVLPVKELHNAKQRLSPHISPELRAGLMMAMAEDVLGTLAKVRMLSGVMVVSVDQVVKRIALSYGAEISNACARAGLTRVFGAAAAGLETNGCAAMLGVPGDIPLVTTYEIDELLSADLSRPSVTLVPSLDGDGTNAMLCSPPTALAFAFGPGSFSRHVESLQTKGIEPRIVRSTGIGLDIDTPKDLSVFMASDAGVRTRRYLRENEAAFARFITETPR